VQLLAYHLWLAAGHRRLADVWPGVAFSIVLWLLAARLFGSWLTISDYSRFYAGLTQIMSALVFFQVSALIIILGAELNRGIAELRRRLAAYDEPEVDGAAVPMPPSRSSYGSDA
jgi:membrane protein